MKKLLAVVLALVMLLCFAACNSDADSSAEGKGDFKKSDVDAIPEAVVREIEAYYDEDLKADIGEMKVQYTTTGYGAYLYVISCEIKNFEDDADNEYEGCWFWGVSWGCDDIARFRPMGGLYQPDEKQILEEDCKAYIEELGEETIDKSLKSTAEEVRGIDYNEN